MAKYKRNIRPEQIGTGTNKIVCHDIDWLSGVTYLDSDVENFVMDDLGNRTGNQTLRDDGTVNFAVDTETNRYTAIAGSPLAYDDAGNQTQDKDGYQYTYDYENRIIEIKDSSNALVATMAYDSMGRRIRVHDAKANDTTHYYYSDNWQVLAEYDESNNQQAYYVYGNYIDETLVMNNGSTDYYYLHDHLYSPVALLNTAGTAVERYEYNAYGKANIMDATYNSRSTSAYGNPYTFTGRRLDIADNGNYTKMHYRHRDYEAYLGRFFQYDPLATTKSVYVDGINLYEYTISRPIHFFDAFGLSPYTIGFQLPSLPAWHQKQIEEISSTHGIDAHNKDWKEALYIKTLVFAGYNYAYAKGFKENSIGWGYAASLLEHYATNTGTTEYIYLPDFFKEDRLARIRLKDDLNTALAYAEKFYSINSSIVSTSWDNHRGNGHPGWGNAINDYRTAGQGRRIRCNNN